MKSSPERASDLLDIYTFHLVFFHLSSTQPPSKLETLQAMRNNVSQKPKKIIFVLVIPELYLDTAGKAADFLLTKPVTVDKLQMVFDGCEFLFQKGDDGSNCNAKPDSDSETVQKESQPHSPRRDPGPSVSERSEPHASPVVRAAPSPPLSPSEDLNCKLQALLHSRKEQRRRLQIKKCCDSLRDLLPFLKNQRIDTASVLEMTVKYMKYLQRKVPQGILSKGVNFFSLSSDIYDL
ncbi:spermatogenesis- and oogenesis-specific basic helix-loop-helix-containing protein 2-like isoform X2 [Amia ocellicauda]